jgi:phosphohistidine swiveling domain-containing protein
MTPAELAAWVPELDTPVWDRFPEVTAANAQEVYPGVGDPLSYDVNLVAIEHGTRTLAHRMGLTTVLGLDEWQDIAFFAAYYGHVYINISTLRELSKWVPQGSPDAIDEQLFGLQRPDGAPSWKPSLRHQLVRIRTLVKVLPILRGMRGDLEANNAAVEAYYQKIQTADLPSLTDVALMRELDEAYRRNLVTCEVHSTYTFLAGSSSFENLRVFLTKQGFDDLDALIADLCTGLTEIESAKPGRELSRLALRIRAGEKLRTFFAAGEAERVLADLRGSDDPEIGAFRREFDNFLRAYGYRGVRELGLTTHVWSMRPESVVGLLQSYVAREDAIDAEASMHKQEQRRAAATARVESHLGMTARRKFRGLLKAAHSGIAGRELAKSQWARSTHAIRLLVIEISRRLHARGVLAAEDDIFFLRLPELKDAMAGRPDPDLAARIARRREDYRRAHEVETDERFSGRPVPRLRQPERPAPAEAAAANGTVLRGIPVSPGCVTAPARVVRELTDDIELQPGEVLVCPFTDAAWTPLFFNAAAVVMDLGGPLSHGSTVAREYGLPAVVNVKTGTRVIRDGQQITVDGTKGEVLLG